ncbi:MAG: PQQ-binding-like beta-propeller repeat protein [Acidobacteria bacterium]|nr:PQQ-binding-like beta-propeller repeat protein [Acidobacteriota bacterium]
MRSATARRPRSAEMRSSLPGVAAAAAALAAAALLVASVPAAAQHGTTGGDWRTWAGDLGATRYAPLDEIDAGNFDDLVVAWTYRTDNLGPSPDFNLQSTPLVVDGVLYTTAGSRRAVVALDAGTGEHLWLYRLDEGERAERSVRRLSGRGVGYWTDGAGDERIYFVTIGYQLVALDAATGRPVPGFGENGIVDLKRNNDQELDPVTSELAWNGAPVVAGDTVIVGAASRPGGTPPSRRNAKGYVRGFDARTGERRWIFHTIPQPGEFGHETWEDGSWEYTGNTGVWTQMTVDAELGIAYLPVEIPTGDYYGGHRPGDNLFAESLVAVDVETGERLWHFQFVHHPVWDYDVPCAPILADITVDGRDMKAIAQPTKQGWVYVFDRVTGEPVWPIEERPVPAGDLPGETYSPTQPFPTRPPPFERQGFELDELLDFTPELHAEALRIAQQYRTGPVFTPPIRRGAGDKFGTLFVPNGANWPGGSYDPETGILYLFSQTLSRVLAMQSLPERSDMAFINGPARGPGQTVQGLPLMKPPWGRITAIDLNTGTIVWQVPHGETPDSVRRHPALRGVDIPRTGRKGPVGTLTTKTLVISGEGGRNAIDRGFFTTPDGRRGAMLRAYDKATGENVGEVYMPAPQTGTPMTYLHDGRQYVVVAVGGVNVPARLIAYTLPN